MAEGPRGARSPSAARGRFLAALCLAAIAAAALVIVYGVYVEPARLIVRHYVVKTEKTKHLRVALMSDLHLPGFRPMEEKILRALEAEKPDLVLLAGDARDHLSPVGPSRAFLERLGARFPLVAVRGDADLCGSHGQCVYCYYKYTLRKDPPFRILRNETADFPRWNLSVSGLDDPTSELDRPDSLGLAPAPPGRFRILLLHSSHKLAEDLSKDKSGEYDLAMAGNTHGGQIFFLRPLLKWRDATIDVHHLRGRFPLAHGELFVTSGIGTSVVPVRLGVPPEILILDIGHD